MFARLGLYIFAAFLTLSAPFLCWATAPALDPNGNAVKTNTSDSNSSSGSCAALTTTNTNDVIFAVAVITNYDANPPGTVSSVADTSTLSWTKIKEISTTQASTWKYTISVWWAPASSALSSDTITFTFNQTVQTRRLFCFAVSNATTYTAPFGATGGGIFDTTSSGATLASPSVTTSESPDFLVLIGAIASGGSLGNCTDTTTGLAGPLGGSDGTGTVCSKALSGTISSQVYNFVSTVPSASQTFMSVALVVSGGTPAANVIIFHAPW